MSLHAWDGTSAVSKALNRGFHLPEWRVIVKLMHRKTAFLPSGLT
nr:MAG TPA: hypothetical protein [Caudoviricetes sp.]